MELQDGVPLFKEYCQFLTEEEASYFLSFPQRWEEVQEMDYKAWELKVKAPKLILSFGDDWKQENQSFFKTVLRKALKKNWTEPIRLVLYGLKREPRLCICTPYRTPKR